MDAKKIVLIVLVLLAVLAFLYPKPRVIGGLHGGPLLYDASAYREEYACLGLGCEYMHQNWFAPHTILLHCLGIDYGYQQCMDCGIESVCFGMTYNRECYNQTTSGKTDMPCR